MDRHFPKCLSLQRRLYVAFCYIIALILFPPALLVGGEVVQLTDATFEHETQASTGSTSGSWLVLFKAKRCHHCQKIAPEYERLSDDAELKESGIVVASVDVPSNRMTSMRFDIRGFPTLIYLHQGKQYRFGGQRNYDRMKDFALREYAQQRGSEVPPPPTAFDQAVVLAEMVWMQYYHALRGKSGVAGKAMVVLTGVVILLAIGTIAMCCLLGRGARTKEKRE